LARKAEASRLRLPELRAFLDGELRRIDGQGAASTGEVVSRVEQLERQPEDKLAETTRTPAAYVGEADDKLDRLLPPPQDWPAPGKARPRRGAVVARRRAACLRRPR
jgi:hypothetical protein